MTAQKALLIRFMSRSLFSIACLLVGLGLMIYAHMAQQEAAAQQSVIAENYTTPIQLAAPDGTAHEFMVELAITPEEQAQGLMHRQILAENNGMLFVWSQPQVLKMWMRNTYIPLDILFFRDGYVMHIEQNMVPHDETPRGPDYPAHMALELPAGTVKKLGIAEGWKLLGYPL